MAGNLVIVESPGKVKTIQNYLGKDFIVKASVGHIRDLQEKTLSIDKEHGFAPEYVVPAGKKKVVSELKKLAGEADMVWLASDEDREGEAISWHLFETLGLRPEKTRRIVFHEITKPAILNAIQNPRDINMDLVNAQQARRVMDRLVGFEISPILWRKLKRQNLSAGRVQSVALRLIVDKEREINAFQSTPFYKVGAVFSPKMEATLDSKFNSIDDARKFLEDSIGATFSVASAEEKEGRRFPSAPFTTSTLQQEAGRKLHFPVGVTMRVAQSLYERGLITYMRTDSTNLSSLALGTAKKYITENFGEAYSHQRQYATKSKGAQEAHEAIRPTFIENVEIAGTAQEQKLYSLIWKRTVASQMEEAKVMNTNIKVASDKRPEMFSIQASRILFDGFLKVYGIDDEGQGKENASLPELHTGDILNNRSISAECKFTQAPSRYSEPTLVKKLEELGIGRPSTYAPIISTLTTGRGYVVKGDKEGQKKTVTNLVLKDGKISSTEKTEVIGAEKGKLMPQEVGILVSDFLLKNFSDIMDYDFTANVEMDFDKIAEGEKVWNEVIAQFYTPFHSKVDESLHSNEYMDKARREIGIAPDGEAVVAKFGRYGAYIQKGDPEKRQFANLNKDQLIETITLEEALKLFELPRTVGEYEGVPVIATKGRFGPYIKYGDKNITLKKGMDPLKVSLDDCIELIKTAATKNNAPIAVFGDIQVLNGRYGPYIKYSGKNYKIPRGKKPESLTEEDCKKIINQS